MLLLSFKGYYFHGSRIITGVVNDLLTRPEFATANKVVFAGSRLVLIYSESNEI